MKNIIQNIVNNIIDPQINILYESDSRIFDLALNDIENINIYHRNDVVQYFYYDIYLTTNCLSVADKKTEFDKYHIKTASIIQTGPPYNFKKEDMIVLRNKLSNVYKIILGQDVAEMWGMGHSDKTFILERGVPVTEHLNKEKDKNILIFNLENNNQINLLYKNLSEQVQYTNIIKKITDKSFDSLSSFIQQHKVCIDIGNKENILFILSSNTPCVTFTDINISHPLLYKVNNVEECLKVIEKFINNEIKPSYDDKDKITNLYNYETFKTTLSNILYTIKTKEIFYHE